jgi:hypothetical protein
MTVVKKDGGNGSMWQASAEVAVGGGGGSGGVGGYSRW